MSDKKKRNLILFAVLPIAIFFLLFVPIVIGNQQQQVVLNAVGFRENSAAPLELENSILIQGKETLAVLVHREWSARQIAITTSVQATKIKAILKQKGHVDIILGEVDNVTSAIFGNSYSNENGENIYKPFTLSNQLDVDNLVYYELEDIEFWLEIIVDVSAPTVVTVELKEE